MRQLLFRFGTCLALTLSCTAAPEGRTPNVIYILADDLGYGDLSCYGQDKLSTPNIDRLAKEGLQFTAHYSGNTVCSPSRAVLMTGQHSGVCHVRGNIKPEERAAPPTELTILPEVFQAAGYATGAFGKWGMGIPLGDGPGNPLNQGFDEFAGWKSQRIAHTYYPSTWVVDGKELPLDEGTYVHDLIMGRAFDFIRRSVEEKKPFFCYIPTAVPHAAMHAPKHLHEKWRKKFPEHDHKIGKYTAGEEACPDVINPIAGYAAMMENLDNQVGELLDYLKELGVDDNTLVLFTSDNGAHAEGGHDRKFWNSTGGLRGMKRDMHEGGIRVPLLARWPGTVPAGEETRHISSFQDMLPTFAELVGQPIPPQNTGISMLPTLRGQPDKQPAHPWLYWEFCKGSQQKIFSRAVRMGDWKAYRKEGQKMELFDLAKDPYEVKNLAGAYPDIVARMRGIMDEAHQPLPDAAAAR